MMLTMQCAEVISQKRVSILSKQDDFIGRISAILDPRDFGKLRIKVFDSAIRFKKNILVEKPDVALIDVGVVKDSENMLQNLRSSSCHIPFIALTDCNDEEELYNLGFNAVISKKAGDDWIKTVLRNFLKK